MTTPIEPTELLVEELTAIAERDMDKLARIHAKRLDEAWFDYQYDHQLAVLTSNWKMADKVTKRLNSVHASAQRQLLRSARGASQYNFSREA